MAFSHRLKTLRKQKGFTQENMASMLNAKLSTYRNWEQGKNNPSNETVIHIAKILGTSTDFLFCNTDIQENRIIVKTKICDDIITTCMQLNEEGQKKVLDYVLDLAALDKYKKGYIEYDNMAG